VQQIALPDKKIIDRFGIDVIDIAQAWVHPADYAAGPDSEWHKIEMGSGRTAYYPGWFRPEKTERGGWYARHEDGTLIASMPPGAAFYDQTFFPWVDGYPDSRRAMSDSLDEAMDKVLWQKMVHAPWDSAGDDNFWKELRRRTKILRENTDKALLIVCGCNLFEWGTFIRRMDNFLMDIYIDQPNVQIFLELLMERHMATLEKVCESVGDLVDVVRFGDDLGMDSGPFMNLETYRALFSEHRKRLCGYVHENSSMHTYLHTCGSVYQYIPDLIDEGIEIINPVQTNCKDMEPDKLKSEFGKDVVFWGGGSNTREILNNGTPEAVKKDVLERLEILSPGGGFVFNTIHNILPDVPPENIVAMFEAIEEFNS
jgi:uroporphyrinogen decarboxylase